MSTSGVLRAALVRFSPVWIGSDIPFDVLVDSLPHRILSPARLPYPCYRKHVAVIPRGFGFNAVLMQHLRVYIVTNKAHVRERLRRSCAMEAFRVMPVEVVATDRSVLLRRHARVSAGIRLLSDTST